VSCSEVQQDAMGFSKLQCVAVCCSVLQCVTVRCSVWQYAHRGIDAVPASLRAKNMITKKNDPSRDSPNKQDGPMLQVCQTWILSTQCTVTQGDRRLGRLQLRWERGVLHSLAGAPFLDSIGDDLLRIVGRPLFLVLTLLRILRGSGTRSRGIQQQKNLYHQI